MEEQVTVIMSSSRVLGLLIQDELVLQFGIGGCAPIGAFPILDIDRPSMDEPVTIFEVVEA